MSATAPNASRPVTEPRDTALPMRFRLARELARGWWLFLLRGIASILFGVFAFLAPGFGLAVILGAIAAWLLLDAVMSFFQSATGRTDAGTHPVRGGRVWLAVEGVVSAIAAVLIFASPLTSAVTIVILVAAWMIASGVLRILLAARAGSWLLGLSGVLGILVGIWLVLAPGAGLLALIWLVAVQAVAAGVMLIALALRLRRIHHDPTPG
ncbi:HdeD family acid-resistance protein [Roseomonas sp. CCTCC AB2023176]|uniref:HdeD family acid-resistance protein n=1 Tax=Roseomonas sp. CCTCC AB2023176 TaxID=3342640 RepID=UPI0035E1D37C